MSQAGPQVNGPASPTGKYIDGIDPDDPQYIKNLQRPAEVKEDLQQMENRSRVSIVLNSQAFKEELEQVVEEQLRSGPYPASLIALQQITDLLLPHSKGSLGSLARASSVIPINDLRGVESLGYIKGEKTLRCKLAALYRLVDLCGWSHGIYNHISARVSPENEHFLLNPFGLTYSEITASSLIKVDIRGDIVESGSTHLGVYKAGFSLHSAIHQARPDIKCIVHLHTPAAVAVSALKCGLLAMSQEALICGKVSYHDFQGVVIDAEEREKLARNIGVHNKILILRNRGVLACGETIEEAFHFTFNVMAACEAQVKAIPVGLDNIVIPSAEAREQTYKVANQGGGGVDSIGRKWKIGELEFEALMRTLDNSGFRTGYVYKMPIVKQDKKERSNSEVEIPPSSSSFTYIFDGDYEHSKYASPVKAAMERQKKAYKAGWLTTPNAYKKTEVAEIGTTTPKKITKWVPEEDSPNRPGGTPVKVEHPNQFAPQGGNPKEYKEKQKSIKKDYYEERITAGPQSRILEGISWDEAQRAKDGQVSGAGDQLIVVGAASKGIIQRDHQHNAVVYRQYYAANPFENMSEAEIEEYQAEVQQRERGEPVEEEIPEPAVETPTKTAVYQSPPELERQETEARRSRPQGDMIEVPDNSRYQPLQGHQTINEEALLARLADKVVQSVIHDALSVARQGKGQQILTGAEPLQKHHFLKHVPVGSQIISDHRDFPNLCSGTQSDSVTSVRNYFHDDKCSGFHHQNSDRTCLDKVSRSNDACSRSREEAVGAATEEMCPCQAGAASLDGGLEMYKLNYKLFQGQSNKTPMRGRNFRAELSRGGPCEGSSASGPSCECSEAGSSSNDHCVVCVEHDVMTDIRRKRKPTVTFTQQQPTSNYFKASKVADEKLSVAKHSVNFLSQSKLRHVKEHLKYPVIVTSDNSMNLKKTNVLVKSGTSRCTFDISNKDDIPFTKATEMRRSQNVRVVGECSGQACALKMDRARSEQLCKTYVQAFSAKPCQSLERTADDSTKSLLSGSKRLDTNLNKMNEWPVELPLPVHTKSNEILTDHFQPLDSPKNDSFELSQIMFDICNLMKPTDVIRHYFYTPVIIAYPVMRVTGSPVQGTTDIPRASDSGWSRHNLSPQLTRTPDSRIGTAQGGGGDTSGSASKQKWVPKLKNEKRRNLDQESEQAVAGGDAKRREGTRTAERNYGRQGQRWDVDSDEGRLESLRSEDALRKEREDKKARRNEEARSRHEEMRQREAEFIGAGRKEEHGKGREDGYPRGYRDQRQNRNALSRRDLGYTGENIGDVSIESYNIIRRYDRRGDTSLGDTEFSRSPGQGLRETDSRHDLRSEREFRHKGQYGGEAYAKSETDSDASSETRKSARSRGHNQKTENSDKLIKELKDKIEDRKSRILEVSEGTEKQKVVRKHIQEMTVRSGNLVENLAAKPDEVYVTLIDSVTAAVKVSGLSDEPGSRDDDGLSLRSQEPSFANRRGDYRDRQGQRRSGSRYRGKSEERIRYRGRPDEEDGRTSDDGSRRGRRDEEDQRTTDDGRRRAKSADRTRDRRDYEEGGRRRGRRDEEDGRTSDDGSRRGRRDEEDRRTKSADRTRYRDRRDYEEVGRRRGRRDEEDGRTSDDGSRRGRRDEEDRRTTDDGRRRAKSADRTRYRRDYEEGGRRRGRRDEDGRRRERRDEDGRRRERQDEEDGRTSDDGSRTGRRDEEDGRRRERQDEEDGRTNDYGRRRGKSADRARSRDRRDYEEDGRIIDEGRRRGKSVDRARHRRQDYEEDKRTSEDEKQRDKYEDTTRQRRGPDFEETRKNIDDSRDKKNETLENSVPNESNARISGDSKHRLKSNAKQTYRNDFVGKSPEDHMVQEQKENDSTTDKNQRRKTHQNIERLSRRPNGSKDGVLDILVSSTQGLSDRAAKMEQEELAAFDKFANITNENIAVEGVSKLRREHGGVTAENIALEGVSKLRRERGGVTAENIALEGVSDLREHGVTAENIALEGVSKLRRERGGVTAENIALERVSDLREHGVTAENIALEGVSKLRRERGGVTAENIALEGVSKLREHGGVTAENIALEGVSKLREHGGVTAENIALEGVSKLRRERGGVTAENIAVEGVSKLREHGGVTAENIALEGVSKLRRERGGVTAENIALERVSDLREHGVTAENIALEGVSKLRRERGGVTAENIALEGVSKLRREHGKAIAENIALEGVSKLRREHGGAIASLSDLNKKKVIEDIPGSGSKIKIGGKVGDEVEYDRRKKKRRPESDRGDENLAHEGVSRLRKRGEAIADQSDRFTNITENIPLESVPKLSREHGGAIAENIVQESMPRLSREHGETIANLSDHYRKKGKEDVPESGSKVKIRGEVEYGRRKKKEQRPECDIDAENIDLEGVSKLREHGRVTAENIALEGVSKLREHGRVTAENIDLEGVSKLREHGRVTAENIDLEGVSKLREHGRVTAENIDLEGVSKLRREHGGVTAENIALEGVSKLREHGRVTAENIALEGVSKLREHGRVTAENIDLEGMSKLREHGRVTAENIDLEGVSKLRREHGGAIADQSDRFAIITNENIALDSVPKLRKHGGATVENIALEGVSTLRRDHGGVTNENIALEGVSTLRREHGGAIAENIALEGVSKLRREHGGAIAENIALEGVSKLRREHGGAIASLSDHDKKKVIEDIPGSGSEVKIGGEVGAEVEYTRRKKKEQRHESDRGHVKEKGKRYRDKKSDKLVAQPVEEAVQSSVVGRSTTLLAKSTHMRVENRSPLNERDHHIPTSHVDPANDELLFHSHPLIKESVKIPFSLEQPLIKSPGVPNPVQNQILDVNIDLTDKKREPDLHSSHRNRSNKIGKSEKRRDDFNKAYEKMDEAKTDVIKKTRGTLPATNIHEKYSKYLEGDDVDKQNNPEPYLIKDRRVTGKPRDKRQEVPEIPVGGGTAVSKDHKTPRIVKVSGSAPRAVFEDDLLIGAKEIRSRVTDVYRDVSSSSMREKDMADEVQKSSRESKLKDRARIVIEKDVKDEKHQTQNAETVSDVYKDFRSKSDAYTDDRSKSDVYKRYISELDHIDGKSKPDVLKDEIRSHVYKDDRSKSDVYKDDRSKSDVYKDDRSKSDAYKDERTKSDVYKDDQFKTIVYIDDRSKMDVKKDDRSKYHVHKYENRSDDYKDDRGKPDVHKDDKSKSDIHKHDVSKPDVHKYDITKTDVHKDNKSKSHGYKDENRSDVYKDEKTKSADYKDDRSKPDVHKDDTSRSDVHKGNKSKSDVHKDDRIKSAVQKEDRTKLDVNKDYRFKTDVHKDDRSETAVHKGGKTRSAKDIKQVGETFELENRKLQAYRKDITGLTKEINMKGVDKKIEIKHRESNIDEHTSKLFNPNVGEAPEMDSTPKTAEISELPLTMNVDLSGVSGTHSSDKDVKSSVKKVKKDLQDEYFHKEYRADTSVVKNRNEATETSPSDKKRKIEDIEHRVIVKRTDRSMSDRDDPEEDENKHSNVYKNNSRHSLKVVPKTAVKVEEEGGYQIRTNVVKAFDISNVNVSEEAEKGNLAKRGPYKDARTRSSKVVPEIIVRGRRESDRWYPVKGEKSLSDTDSSDDQKSNENRRPHTDDSSRSSRIVPRSAVTVRSGAERYPTTRSDKDVPDTEFSGEDKKRLAIDDKTRTSKISEAVVKARNEARRSYPGMRSERGIPSTDFADENKNSPYRGDRTRASKIVSETPVKRDWRSVSEGDVPKQDRRIVDESMRKRFEHPELSSMKHPELSSMNHSSTDDTHIYEESEFSETVYNAQEKQKYAGFVKRTGRSGRKSHPMRGVSLEDEDMNEKRQDKLDGTKMVSKNEISIKSTNQSEAKSDDYLKDHFSAVVHDNPIEYSMDSNKENEETSQQQSPKKGIFSLFSCVAGRSADASRMMGKSQKKRPTAYYEEGEKRKIKKLSREKDKEERKVMYFEKPDDTSEGSHGADETFGALLGESQEESVQSPPPLPDMQPPGSLHVRRTDRYQKRPPPFRSPRPLSTFIDPSEAPEGFVTSSSEDDQTPQKMSIEKQDSFDEELDISRSEEGKFRTFMSFGKSNIKPSIARPALDKYEHVRSPESETAADVSVSGNMTEMREKRLQQLPRDTEMTFEGKSAHSSQEIEKDRPPSIDMGVRLRHKPSEYRETRKSDINSSISITRKEVTSLSRRSETRLSDFIAQVPPPTFGDADGFEADASFPPPPDKLNSSDSSML